MSTQLRITLPISMGIASLPLMFWDIHNERVIVSMGMAWDMGAPIWPYQTSDILLRLLNGPAYFITMPLANTFRLVAPSHYLLVFPAILLWWWFLGLRLDHGLVITKSRWRWPVFSVLVVLAVVLLLAATSISAESFRWWFRYAEVSSHLNAVLMMTRFLTPAAWCVFIALLALTAAKRVATATRIRPVRDGK
jgi:hypothetical protein